MREARTAPPSPDPLTPTTTACLPRATLLMPAQGYPLDFPTTAGTAGRPSDTSPLPARPTPHTPQGLAPVPSTLQPSTHQAAHLEDDNDPNASLYPDIQQGTEVNQTHDSSSPNIDFQYIADWCAIEKPTQYNVTPKDLQAHRKCNWPNMSNKVDSNTRSIYQAVKNTGLPNCMAARVPLHTGINVAAWRNRMDGSPEEAELVDFIEFGFPIAYNGPATHTHDPSNHASAMYYPEHVQEFLKQELDHGALVGPQSEPIFQEWAHISLMMTRPKSDPDKRRIITDLSYPPPIIQLMHI